MLDRKALIPVLLTLLVLGSAHPAYVSAQEEAAAVDEETVVEIATESEAEPIPYTDLSWDLGYTINTLIMFLCAVLVLFMQAGFAMVEVGLNSQKNTINILFKNLMDLCLGVVLFLFVGYGLMYPGGTDEEKAAKPWFKFGSSMVSRDSQGFDEATGAYETPPTDLGGAPYASNAADFMFQVAFAATAATIVSGAVAGRLQFISYLIYSVIISGLIYPISGYWKWGGGQLAQWGFHDFAGSVVVHAVGGFAGLAGAIALGPRIGRYTSEGKSMPMPGHNITFAALGVFILWIGWYGFNPGSQLTYNGAVNAEATTYIALTTTISAAAGAISAMICSWAKFGKPDITMALNGALAGLVGITANCDRVSEPEALAIGAIAGAIVFFGVLLLDVLKIDDPVGAVPVHAFCGVWGGLATGIFGDIPDGLATRGEFFLVQLKSTAIISTWAFVTMLIVFYGLKAAGILRVSPEEEQRGLDISEHGMEAYT
ncbi:MAG: ammonium transporter, partial [Planctomycetaceae bacterium]